MWGTSKMDLQLKNKVAIIGGSSKGLGKGCALQLAKEGANVVICARNEDALLKTANEIKQKTSSKILAIQADLSKDFGVEKVINKTLAKFRRIDILVNNSGGPQPGEFMEFTDKDWDKAYESLLLYVVRMCRLVIPHMKKNKWGRIINITSLTVKEPEETLILSNVFRSGVVSLAKSISKDLIKYNITINNLCPGAFKTDRAIELMKNQAKNSKKTIKDIEKENVSKFSLGRYQEPEELGNLVAFLCSELAKGITGTTLQIDGGISKCLF